MKTKQNCNTRWHQVLKQVMLHTSIGLNSTLQPMEELEGGGLNLIVCQLVD